MTDDTDDLDEDLTPGDDLGTNDLYIWVFDTPSVGFGSLPNVGDRLQTRYQFSEVAQYAGVKVSPTIPWYWDSAETHTATVPFQQDNTYAAAGDNVVKGGTTRLTANLGPSTVAPIKILQWSPGNVTTAQQKPVEAGISVSGLPVGVTPLAYLIRQVPQDKRTLVQVIPLTISDQIPQDDGSMYIKAFFNVPAIPKGSPRLGDYDLKVFLEDKVDTLKGALTIQSA